jgi:cholesterol transport system auxiliary component
MRKLIVLLPLILAACVSMDKEFPDKRFYVIEAERGEVVTPPSDAPILRMQRLDIAPAYEGKSLVYRTGELSYASDFYHAFFVAPAALIGGETRAWLQASGLFSRVTSSTDAGYTLQGNVASLYGDYTDEASSRAVLEIQFLLLGPAQDSPAKVVLQRNYCEEVSLADRSPEALARGFSDALGRILTALEKDMAGQI